MQVCKSHTTMKFTWSPPKASVTFLRFPFIGQLIGGHFSTEPSLYSVGNDQPRLRSPWKPCVPLLKDPSHPTPLPLVPWKIHDNRKFSFFGRASKAERVFREIHFEQIPSKYLTKEIVPNLCEKYNICVDRVKEVLDQHASGNNTHKTQTSKSDFARKPQDVIYVISCRTNLVERFDSVTCACVRCHEMTGPAGTVESLSENRYAVVVGHELYCVCSSKVDKFNLLELCWTEVGEGEIECSVLHDWNFRIIVIEFNRTLPNEKCLACFCNGWLWNG